MRVPLLFRLLEIPVVLSVVSLGAQAQEPPAPAIVPVQNATKGEAEPSQDAQPLFAGRNFDTWVHLLNVDLDEATRWEAVKAIGVLGARGRQSEALQILSPLLQSENRGFTYNAHQAIALLGDPGIALLVKALQDPSYPHRESIVQALGKAGPSASGATDALIQITKQSDIQLRRRAFESLVAIGAPADPIVGAIEKEVERNDDPHLSQPIIFALAKSPLGYHDKERLLLRLMESDDTSVRHAAASTLAQVGQPTDVVRGVLREALRGYVADPQKRGACPNVGAVDMNVELLLPLLIEVANEQDLKNPSVRGGVFLGNFVSQVGELGESGRPTVPTLIKILQSREAPAFAQIDTDVIQCLWKIGAGATEALPALQQLKEEVSKSSAYRDRDRIFHLRQIDQAIQRIQEAVPSGENQAN